MLRELNINEMEIVSGGYEETTQGDPFNPTIHDDPNAGTISFQDGAGNTTYFGGFAALGLGISGFSSGPGSDDAGAGSAGLGAGFAVEFGSSSDVDQAVVDQASSVTVCFGPCTTIDLNTFTFEFNLSAGIGIFIPFFRDGKSVDEE